MTLFDSMTRTLSDVVTPLLRRPNRQQVAALCYRQTATGREVLLITSRDTGRWILPKGWPMDGLTYPAAALKEAWEEAGVKDGVIQPAALGQYTYHKRLDEGFTTPCTVDVFAVEVTDLQAEYPERPERDRRWMSPTEAASHVDEPELKALVRRF